MPILVDGNNLLHQLPPARRSREEVRRMVLDRTRHQRQTVIVVFDGAPPAGGPEMESLGTVTIRYAGNRTADDVIVGTLPEGPRARQWAVVTDDRELQRRARERGAEVRPLAALRPARDRSRPARTSSPADRPLSAHELAEWERMLTGDRPSGGEPAIVPRRRPSKRAPR